MKTILSSILILWGGTFLYGQLSSYNHKRKIKGISDTWHSLTLPDALYEKVNTDLSDIRIYGITAAKDTLEAPYLLKLNAPKRQQIKVDFRRLNQSQNKRGYYFTFELTSLEVVNQIILNFNQQNFDWKVQLEGSQNLKEWFSIIEDYRILSIKNIHTNYNYTTLSFPDSKYRYYKILVKADEKPRLNRAYLQKQVMLDSLHPLKEYPIKKFELANDKITKQTQIAIDLDFAVPLSELNLNVSDDIDYYRTLQINYALDSVETDKGWKPIYQSLFYGTLSSLQKEPLRFKTTIAKKLRILIENNDNAPLTIDRATLMGYSHTLSARFTTPATYYLAYGNPQKRRPTYDLNAIASAVPKHMSPVRVDEEQDIPQEQEDGKEALFTNPIWLWSIMGIVIFLLGGLTIKMLRKS
ncbi:DUF3999 family protein [Spongiimicrobium salis]|uniref:DUF3999 family protein n=1 Tax=Spongiimicrobium salis TaxID=1667022 RepID=UPI00374CA804